MSSATTHKAAKRLLVWYERNKRDLPWRRRSDAYSIWVSEIMLQQTRVETVLPYYARFIERFPSVESLAIADKEEVLGLWSGLGYYRRARLLHRAAQEVVAGGGEIPNDVKGLQALPGIGPYTAAAIASIAFGRVVPAIDGNSERVITRYLALGGDPRRGEARKGIEGGANDLLDTDRPGDSNQALMELGATVCHPRNPECSACPLESICRARLSGDAEAFPAPRARASTVHLERSIAVVRRREQVLLFRRHEDSTLLAGMWELPWVERHRAEPPTERLAERLAERYGGEWILGERRGEVRHAITNRAFRIEIWEASIATENLVEEGPEASWFTEDEIAARPTSSLVEKVLEKARPASE